MCLNLEKNVVNRGERGVKVEKKFGIVRNGRTIPVKLLKSLKTDSKWSELWVFEENGDECIIIADKDGETIGFGQIVELFDNIIKKSFINDGKIMVKTHMVNNLLESIEFENIIQNIEKKLNLSVNQQYENILTGIPVKYIHSFPNNHLFVSDSTRYFVDDYGKDYTGNIFIREYSPKILRSYNIQTDGSLTPYPYTNGLGYVVRVITKNDQYISHSF